MTESHTIDDARTAVSWGDRAAVGIGLVIVLVAIAVLLGWVVGIDAITRLHPEWASMKVNTALCLLGLGAAVVLHGTPAGIGCATLSGLLAALSLVEILTGWNPGIDEALIADPAPSANAAPGRMSPATAVCLLMLSVGSLIPGRGRVSYLRIAVISIASVVSLIAVVVYLYDVQALYHVPLFSGMALHTALGCLLIGLVALIQSRATSHSRPRPGRRISELAMRRLLPVVIVVPVLLGWFCAAAVQHGYLQTEFAIGVFATLTIVVGVMTLLWVAMWIGDLEIHREELRQYDVDRGILRAFETSMLPKLMVNAHGVIQASNQFAEQLFGFSADELRGMPVEELVPMKHRAGHARLRAEFITEPVARPMGPERELTALRKDGREIPVQIGLAPISSTGGVTIVVSIVDLSHRKASENAIREREERLSLVFEATNDAIWDYSVQTGAVWWNQRADGLLGFEKRDVQRSWDWLRGRVHPEDRERVRESWNAALAGSESTWDCEYRIVRPDGSMAHVRDRARIARADAGEPLRVVGAMLDQTTDKEAELRLRESAARSHAMADQAPMLMWMSDSEGAIDYVNRAWTRFTGGGAESVQNGRWLEYVYAEDRERFRRSFDDARSRQEAMTQEFRLRDSRGRYRWVLWHVLPWHQVDANVGGYIGCGVDIDRMKSSIDDLARSNAELEHFAYVASHDLQEPLRMVSSFCELLHERYADKLDADAKEFIHFAVDGARRMQQLIEDLLKYSRVGRADIEFEVISADRALDQALATLTSAIRDAAATVHREPLPQVSANLVQLSLVFQNLIGNAIKFRSNASPEVWIGANALAGGWRVFVRDNGIGIDERHFERIFRIFQRLQPRGDYPGSGIGLAIAKKIVEAHGGWIEVTSSEHGGSTFSFWLPSPGARDASGQDAGMAADSTLQNARR